MKIAGRKNQGAWYRTNVWLKDLTGDDRDNVKNQILAQVATLSPFMTKVQDLATAAGVSIADQPTTADQFVETMMTHGIPLQVWMGKPTFSHYIRSGLPGSYKYKQDGVKEYRKFGKALRTVIKKFQFGNRQVRDIFNLGALGEQNPGGYPDINPEI